MNEWYFRDPACHEVGPLSTEEFDEHVAAGVILPDTEVWHPGLGEWTPYATLLAQEEPALEQATTPVIRTTPASSSYRTQIALGLSRVSRHSLHCRAATPVASASGLTRSTFEVCRSCGEEVALHLFVHTVKGRVCPCCAHSSRAPRARRYARAGKLLVRCALTVATLILGVAAMEKALTRGEARVLAVVEREPAQR